jgi:ABC-type lipoprotein release transport system permease subunit
MPSVAAVAPTRSSERRSNRARSSWRRAPLAHRRRSELALLKTLGFERGQVRATLAWQATTLATVGLAVGIPVGVLVGNVVWRHVASSLGISPVVIFPVVAVALTVPCVIALVNAVGFGPARKAERTWPADALSAE